MKPFIENGNYAMIIGDDASGRLPAIALKNIIDKVYKKSGRDNIEAKFIALYPTRNYLKAWQNLTPSTKDIYERPDNESEEQRRHDATNKIKKEFVDKISGKIEADKKILIVTDVIGSGSSLRPLMAALKEANLHFEIACIGMMGGRREIQQWGAEKIFTGVTYQHPIYAQRELAGVVKDTKTFNLRAKPIKNTPEYSSIKKEEQSRINKARQDAHRVGEQVFEAVWGEEIID